MSDYAEMLEKVRKRSITIILPGLPKSLNGAHGHWRVAAAERKTWRTAAALSARAAWRKAGNSEPLSAAWIKCTRFSYREMDFDNLVASFKGCIDGLKDAGVIQDDSSRIIQAREYAWRPAAQKNGRIEITVGEI